MIFKKVHINNDFFQKLFLCFLIIVISAFIISLTTTIYYTNLLKKRAQIEYKQELSRVSEYLNTTLEEINKTTELFSLSGELNSFISSDRKLKSNEYYIVSMAVSSLQKFKLTKSFIDSIYIFNPINDLVISDRGTCSIDEYFNYIQSYSNYSQDFWLHPPVEKKKYEILLPSNIIDYNNTVIPVIQYSTDNYTYNNTFVVNITEDYVIQLLNNNNITQNSIIFINDNKGNYIYDESKLALQGLCADNLKGIVHLASNDKPKTIKIFNENYIIIQHNDSNLNYKYYALIPYSDFFSEIIKSSLLPLMIIFSGIIIVILLSYSLSKKLYLPIKVVSDTLKKTLNNNKNNNTTIEYLSNSINQIINDNKQLQQDISLALPYVCERYLFSILNNNKILQEKKVREFLSSYNIKFPHNNFIVINTALNFNKNFFSTHSKNDYNTICQGSLIIANKTFTPIKNKHIFFSKSNQMCIILNVNDAFHKETISDCLRSLHNNIEQIDGIITLHSGIGGFHKHLNGLQKSYQESLKAYSQITGEPTSMIRIFRPSDDEHSNFYYSKEEENIVFNSLFQGNRKNVEKNLDNIIKNNADNHICNHAFKELYLQLYTTAIRVMNKKEISVYNLMRESYIDLSSNISTLSLNEIKDYIYTLFHKLISDIINTNSIYDITNLKKYLDENFYKEIYLSLLAERFGVSSKHMSKLIKKELGVTFQEYISTLRINKAKELLSTTNKIISDIALEVGFNNRQPFIRKFKLLEGITPSEYRKLYSDTKKIKGMY